MARVRNVSGSSRNNKPNAKRQYQKLTGKTPPKGTVVAHVTKVGQGKKQYLVPVTPKQNHYTNTNSYSVSRKPVPVN